MDTTWVEVDADKVTAGDPVSVTVTPAPATASYKVDLEGTQTVQMGETAPVTVTSYCLAVLVAVTVMFPLICSLLMV